ncbi:MAG: CBS domain-containing protein [Arenimonas sp.]
MRIQDICTHRVATITASEPLIDAAAVMREHHVGNLVVVENIKNERKVVGILTDRDIIVSVVAAGLTPESLLVSDVMSKPVYCCGGTQSVFDAVAIMREQGVRRLPVLDEQGSLVGIIAADDIWIALSNQLKILGEITVRERIGEINRRM